MNHPHAHCLVLTTVSTAEQAQSLAQHLVREQLAACVQIHAIQSHYMWKGEVCQEGEFQLQIKTRTDLYGVLELAIMERHPYETPEIVQLAITAGSAAYLGWVDEVTRTAPIAAGADGV
jgi:periplasmic divalent cation tolerance protein